MTGLEFWVWATALITTSYLGARAFIALWRDRPDRIELARYRWPLGDDQ